MKYLSVERLSSDKIICEDDKQNLYTLSPNDFNKTDYAVLKEGDILKMSDDGDISIDVQETLRVKNKINALRKKLMNIKN